MEIKRVKAKQEMHSKEKRKSDTVIGCWNLNKQAGHVKQNVPDFLWQSFHTAKWPWGCSYRKASGNSGLL